NEAVQSARNEIVNRKQYQYHPWPLLRIFTDGTPLTPIIDRDYIDKGRNLNYQTARAATVQYLEGAAVKVLRVGFIGCRREVQRGISAIKGVGGKYGAIILGTAGNGKSCLAGKLIVRFNNRDNAGSAGTGKELIALHGIARQMDIVGELFKISERKGNDQALNILKSDAEYEDKIKALLRGPLNKMPT
ncbi:MAG: hypothetical protein HQK89_17950, partial [Nitrospirae bacterium]|nr:hypothetical protein [Nitrospirota bacterium]